LAIQTCHSAPCCCCSRRGLLRWIFIVPISALIQHQPGRQEGRRPSARRTGFPLWHRRRFRCIYAATHYAHLSPGGIFSGRRGNAAATAYVLWLLPDSLLRLVLWFARTLCIVWMLRGEKRAGACGALLTPNHVSMADAVLSSRRSIVDPLHHVQGLLRAPAGKTVCKIMGVIPSRRIKPARNDPFLAPGDGRAENGEIVASSLSQ